MDADQRDPEFGVEIRDLVEGYHVAPEARPDEPSRLTVNRRDTHVEAADLNFAGRRFDSGQVHQKENGFGR